MIAPVDPFIFSALPQRLALKPTFLDPQISTSLLESTAIPQPFPLAEVPPAAYLAL